MYKKWLVMVLLAVVGTATAQIKLTQVGEPTWQPVDFSTFAAPIGTSESGYAEFGETMQAILPPPNHVWIDGLGIGPGAPHPPPYDTEMSTGVANAGFDEQLLFLPDDFTAPSGIWVTFMLVPTADAPEGRTPDYESGPMIANALCPLHVEGVTLRNGQMYDPWLAWMDVPGLDTFPQFADTDGHSHIPIFIADCADFGPPGTPLVGSYEFSVELRDNAGNGWDLWAKFRVLPAQAKPPVPVL
jgi:hypothetical protein